MGICYTQCHVLGLFLVIHFAPSFRFGCNPSLLAQMHFVAWQEGPFEVSGALVRRVKSRESGKTHQRHRGPEVALLLDCDSPVPP